MGLLFKAYICSLIIPGTFCYNGGCAICTLEISLSGWKHVTHAEYPAATKRSLPSKICVTLTNVTEKRPVSFVGANIVVSKKGVLRLKSSYTWEKKKYKSLLNRVRYSTSFQGLFHPRAKKLSPRGFIVSSSHHLNPRLRRATLPAMACATPARLKMLLRPMLCTQHPSRAAITVTDIAARPADRKNRDAFQHPGKTLESVAKPSTLKFAQCVLPNNLVQRL